MEHINSHKIRFIVMGCGNIGRRHAEEITANPAAELVAIVDVAQDVRNWVSEKYHIPVFHNIESCFASGIVADVVNICAPNGYHVPLALEAVDAGCHVLVEKPMGLKKSDCEHLLSHAAAKGKRVFCVLQNRYSPPSRFIHQVISENRLGKIYWVAVNCYWNRDERYYTPGSWRGTAALDGGPLYTQFSHFIDLLCWNFGPLKNISARMYNFNHPYLENMEDSGSFSFEMEGGGAGQFNWSTSLYQTNLESSITIIGEKGTIKAGGQYMENIEFFRADGMDAPVLENAMPANDYGHFKGSAANHIFVIENIIKALNDQPYNMASAEEAMESVGLIEEVYKFRRF